MYPGGSKFPPFSAWPQEVGTLKAHVHLEAAEETDGTQNAQIEVVQNVLPVERFSKSMAYGYLMDLMIRVFFMGIECFFFLQATTSSFLRYGFV